MKFTSISVKYRTAGETWRAFSKTLRIRNSDALLDSPRRLKQDTSTNSSPRKSATHFTINRFPDPDGPTIKNVGSAREELQFAKVSVVPLTTINGAIIFCKILQYSAKLGGRLGKLQFSISSKVIRFNFVRFVFNFLAIENCKEGILVSWNREDFWFSTK